MMDAVLLDFYYNNNNSCTEYDVSDYAIDITITYLEQLRATLSTR